MKPHVTAPSRVAWVSLFAITTLVAACDRTSDGEGRMPESRHQNEGSAEREQFGMLPDGTPIDVITLTNLHAMEVRAITYGGIITALRVPDRNGDLADVVLGHDDLAAYLAASPYFGAIVGRYANRIANGRFALDGHSYQLAVNNGQNHLHGGLRGFDKVVWSADPFVKPGSVGVVFRYTSPDGEEGYPGRLDVKVTYTLTDRNELAVDYHATTDRPTPINLTQHSYFNLAGEGRGSVLEHVLVIHADSFTPVDSTLIPTGEIVPVAGTPLDFTAPTSIGERIEQPDRQLAYGHGYDHNFVLNRTGPGLVLAVEVYEPTTGRTMDVYTTEPGLQLYTGNFLDGTITGKAGHVYGRHAGFSLETQHFPDSPNHAEFPSSVLRPGAVYDSRTVFAFGIKRE